MEKCEKWDWEEWGKSKIVPFPPIFLPFPINFTHFLYASQNSLLAMAQNSPFPPIPPHFPAFPPISPIFHFPHFSKPRQLGGYFGCG